MSKHINSLTIKKYRGLKDVDIQGLNDINIFTGTNNAGKTSILELLCIISNPFRLENWLNASYNAHFAGHSIYTEILRLFPFNEDMLEIDISYSDKSGKERIYATAKETSTSVPKRELLRINGFMTTGNNKIPDEEMEEMKHLVMDIEAFGKNVETGVYEKQTRLLPVEGVDENDSFPVIYISPTERLSGYNRYLKEVVKNTVYVQAMVNILKKFDDRITGLTIIEDECWLYTSNSDNAVPIGVYGAGMKKAVYILAAIIMAQGGIVLVDEFETSIHEEATEDVFKIIFETAKDLDVQIFMTSHSTLAIKSLLNIENIKENLNLYTLYNQDKYLVRQLDGTDIEKALELGVAIR